MNFGCFASFSVPRGFTVFQVGFTVFLVAFTVFSRPFHGIFTGIVFLAHCASLPWLFLADVVYTREVEWIGLDTPAESWRLENLSPPVKRVDWQPTS